jgi:2'-5' RNA ligase
VEATTVRSFLAVLLPEPVRGAIDEVAGILRQAGAPVAWVRAENLHLTLRFLGAVDEARLGCAREALEAVAEQAPPFAVVLGGLGGFPSRRAPRVVWVGVEAGGSALGALHARIEAALERCGFAREGRPFQGHVTLGRARDPRGAPALAEALAAAAAQGPRFGEVPVEAVCLMRSDLHPTGARYTVLARAALRGSSGGTPAR